MSNRITAPFGELPFDWKYEKIGTNIEFATGPAFDSTQFNIEGVGHRLVRGINLTTGITRWGNGNTRYWKSLNAEFKKYELQTGDIVIGMDGSLVGKNYAQIRVSDLPALLVQRVARLRGKENLDQRYLYYMFGNDAWISYVEIVKTNSGIPHISNGDIKNFHIPFPKFFEQQKIAAILTAVDDVIESTQAQINKLKDLKTGMMQELLTKGIGHTEFKDSPVGRIPTAWEVKPLGFVVERIIDCEHKTAPYVDKSEYIVVRTNNVKNGQLIFDDIKYTTHDAYIEWTSRLTPTEGDVLFTREAPAGESCMVPKGHKVCMGQRMVLLRPNKLVMDGEYFSIYLNSQAAIDSIFRFSIGTTVSRINIEDIKKIRCVVPSLNEQKRISESVRSVQNSILALESKVQTILNTKKALMQDLLTGKVRVSLLPASERRYG